MKKIYFILAVLPYLAVAQKTKEIEEVVFQKRAKKKTTDLTNTSISAKEAQQIASISGGIEGLIKTLPSVNSNTELSSQYMVRGGNYDENLIYINDVELYRPFLIRNAQQEGMSIINPDMVSTVNFSSGGFEARYGDKMSSALNVYYREPEKTELSGEASLIGGRLTLGGASKDKKLTALVSGRYRNTNLVLNTLNEDTDFNPQNFDIQTFINYHINPKWQLSFIGYYAKNDYTMLPKQRKVNFGTLQAPMTLTVFYNGRENDTYKNMMGTASVHFKPNKKWKFSLDNFAYQNREKEYYTISSAYELQAYNPVTGEPTVSYDIGGQIDHARNDLLVRTLGSQFRARFSPDVNTDYEVGIKYEKEFLQDYTNEWQLADSLGYSTPRASAVIGQLDPSDLKLKFNIRGQNDIQPSRLSAYIQASKKFFWQTHKVFINGGVRTQHWSFNNQTIVSPRLQIAIKPDWDTDMLFRLAGGIYYQAPFYREIKDLEGNFNSNIKAQRSLQLILGNDYEFQWKDRPFKLTTEAYYKKMNHLIPYYVDNVRIRYSGQNNSEGYAYGIDTRLFGEFVPGVDSWLSLSYARVFENIDNKGYIPRPTDQRFRVAMFYQDYMPKFPSMRVNLTLIYASGLPNGASVFADPYQYQKTLPAYKRVDIGLSKIFIDQKDFKANAPFWRNFKELTLGVQVFNAFNINNTISNQWINDANTGYIYPVPVRLTGRFFNVKLEFKL
ncbi:TonB-dependent receptor plug domain-containing protein [Riemerella anatipestifer]|uniref:TonB-dependent receptor plug domain-containing protein n=1 Tax=Riemerella anatipestifer TaxID=34085 RepID=A0AAP6LLI4_RIEAN|nr:TonB-dependent receptor plug domain-containing protein [Riemerella anatipestifer]MBT0548495.1 TonB-dependent receptor plug domain-containing protein [Riemerella anatipestifer]MBT0555617.1 TonB-dependent receptor plug domain-containing protein [Riemerella anatipestifer]MBT0559258.1 TonB-dependent receptor plug domain-containing protein [Riemerella anatipestifer]MCD5967667.1 TonB-dependent receptor plug domain-containing protein [Riemerella anatipestifer]MCO7355195.1 TonB-dependent receptor p